MMQPHGGDIEGWHFPLRKGTEVLFTFLGGDPDRPVIAGVVPNAHHAEPGHEGEPHEERHPDGRAKPNRDRGQAGVRADHALDAQHQRHDSDGRAERRSQHDRANAMARRRSTPAEYWDVHRRAKPQRVCDRQRPRDVPGRPHHVIVVGAAIEIGGPYFQAVHDNVPRQVYGMKRTR